MRRIRYNQTGAVCYCQFGQTQGRQKISGTWKPIECNKECKYRIVEKGKTKPACLFEGNLRFLLPEISQDRIWRMQIKGYTSVFALKEYLDFQKFLGKSLVGDYYLFLKKKKQTSKIDGKSYENFILDIVKKEDFISEDNTLDEAKKLTVISPNVDNSTQNSDKNGNENNSNIAEKNNSKETKTTTKRKKTTNKETVEETSKITKLENTVSNEENSENNNLENKFKNYYLLVSVYTKDFQKDGKPTEYLVGTFVDQNDKTVDAVIPPQYIEEILHSDAGTTVVLDLKRAGNNIIANHIEFVKKLPKDVAA